MEIFSGEEVLDFHGCFKTDQDCLKYLADLKWSYDFTCVNCKNNRATVRPIHSKCCTGCKHVDSPENLERAARQLGDWHINDSPIIRQNFPATINDFDNENRGIPYNILITQRGSGLFSGPFGPNIRYIEDPLYPNVVLDLRHILVLAKETTEADTDFIEDYQYYVQGIPFLGDGDPNSGRNEQDYLSNKLGHSFYKNYFMLIVRNPTKISTYLRWFLSNPANRNSK